ncbi:MAG: hypothetical protein HC802_19425, partial [Caldilineaceae bacterium]|nr:hypothetical protein [Caldilineaceae bacterium]
VGEANTAFVTLKVNVPPETTPSDESFEYSMIAVSEGSGGSAASGELVIRLKAE